MNQYLLYYTEWSVRFMLVSGCYMLDGAGQCAGQYRTLYMFLMPLQALIQMMLQPEKQQNIFQTVATDNFLTLLGLKGRDWGY